MLQCRCPAGSPILRAIFLHFVLYVTGFRRLFDRIAGWSIVYGPAVVFAGAFLMTYDKRRMLVHTPYGWVFRNVFPSVVSQLHLFWALLLGLTVTVLFWVYYRKVSGNERKNIRNAAIAVTLVVLVVLVLSLLKRFQAVDLFFLNGITIMIAALIMGFLIRHYRILITPAMIVDEILASMEDGMIITAGDGTIIKVNSTVLRLTGYTEEDLHKKPVTLLLPDVVSNETPGKRANTVDPEFPSFESVITPKAGSDIPVRYAMSTVRHHKGGGTARIYLFRDLTQYKAIEGKLQKAQKLETFEMLTRSIIHDFNNLLCSISVRLSMYDADETLSDETRLNLKATNQTALFASELIKRFGTFFKDTTPVRKPCDLAAIVQQSADMVQCDGRSFIVISNLAALPQVEGVSQQLMQVFLNLFINARQAMDNSGKVHVTGEFSTAGETVTLSVNDEGCGMAPKVADSIFQPFYTTKKSGSGLGLAIVANIIKSHNGTISVSSAEGSGTTFTITLPVLSPGGNRLYTGECEGVTT